MRASSFLSRNCRSARRQPLPNGRGSDSFVDTTGLLIRDGMRRPVSRAGCVKIPKGALDEVQKGDRLMKKNTIVNLQVTKSQIRRMAAKQRLTVGLALGDRTSRYWILDEAGEKANEDQLPTTKTGLDSLFGKMPPCGAVEGIVRHEIGRGH